MRIAHRWLLSGAIGAVLFAPTAGRAQQPPSEGPLSPPAGGTPAAPAPAPGSPFGGLGGGPAGPVGTYLPPTPIVPGQPISVMVFPFGFPSDAAPEPAPEGALQHRVTVQGAPPEESTTLTTEQRQLAARATAAVKAALLATPAYEVQTYHPRSALVVRGRNQGVLEPAHLQDLYSASGEIDPEKARLIAHRLGIQAVLIGTIEPNIDAAANRAEVTIDAQLVNSTTADVIRAGVVSGAAQGTEGVAQTLVIDRAVTDAAHRLYPALGIQLVTPPPPAATDEDSRRRGGRRTPRERRQAAPERAAAVENGRDADVKTAAPAGEAVAQPPAAPAAPGETVAPAPAPDPNAVKAVADQAGEPVPYGYAKAEVRERRDRSGIKIPSWLGLAAFLVGVSFLL
ncbi:MAG: hypothetical protein ACK47B_02220 [Armatimonadota bacterium]